MNLFQNNVPFGDIAVVDYHILLKITTTVKCTHYLQYNSNSYSPSTLNECFNYKQTCITMDDIYIKTGGFITKTEKNLKRYQTVSSFIRQTVPRLCSVLPCVIPVMEQKRKDVFIEKAVSSNNSKMQ